MNFLRYSERKWNLIAGNKFAYHNRRRRPDYLELARRHGFTITYQQDEVLDVNLEVLRSLPVHPDFQGYSDEDLACSHLYIELKAPCPDANSEADAKSA